MGRDMARIYDCSAQDQQDLGTRMATSALGRGELVVVPTDTVYGIAADAFSPDAVAALLAAKGRTRQSPPPVLVADESTVRALAAIVPDEVGELLSRFAPGPLTVILPAQPSLRWDLGDTAGTVALRIPDQPVALALLRQAGPLAVSSANRHGEPPAETAQDAVAALGSGVEVALDAGRIGGTPSTIIDATALARGAGGSVHIVRQGALSADELRTVLGDLLVEPVTGG